MTIFPECPLPLDEYPRVLLAHGGGGRLTQNLIERVLLPSFNNPYLAPLHDGALLDLDGAGLPSRPTPMSSSRRSSRAATSVDWPSSERPTTSRCAARVPCF